MIERAICDCLPARLGALLLEASRLPGRMSVNEQALSRRFAMACFGTIVASDFSVERFAVRESLSVRSFDARRTHLSIQHTTRMSPVYSVAPRLDRVSFFNQAPSCGAGQPLRSLFEHRS